MMILRCVFASTVNAAGVVVIMTGGIGHTVGGRLSRGISSRDGWGRQG